MPADTGLCAMQTPVESVLHSACKQNALDNQRNMIDNTAMCVGCYECVCHAVLH